MTTTELHDWIKSQLGYPTFEVEVTEDQISQCIRSAIDEITNHYSVTKYLTLDLNGRTCIDLSEYKVHEVTDVIRVDVSGLTGYSSDGSIDPFSYGNGITGAYMGSGIYPGFAALDYSSQRIGQTNIHRVISSYARMYQEQFYNVLAQSIAQRTINSLMPGTNWDYDVTTSRLYVSVGGYQTGVITIEYIPDTVEVEDFEPNTRYIGYLRDMATANALMIQARVTGKYAASNSPVAVNYSDMRADAQAMLERVRTELKATQNTFYIIG